ncbi:hypothetical protein M408DRAFT_22649 [Serendipita vermifera MAFF 305830]|uniref:NADH dehydrogenase [ubiquinone] 1 beta subcomplex subunit 2 n=1 Tax=Serendipita vermifera MAFF 305830 TaxID=933852 RepID=A0A0C3BCE0_SERVB|nr:hypothetical protein M408DRAFT_22649 [Serendipita vermifera MAFF 305830]
MGSGAHTHYTGFHPHPPALRYRVLSQLLGASMWFFIFYRAKQDGPKLLGAHPWEAHGHGHGDKKDEHGHH